MKEQADQPGEVYEEWTFEVFMVSTPEDSTEWVEAHHEDLQFDWDPTQTTGNTAVIWPVEPGDDPRLAQALDALGLNYYRETVC